MYTLIRNIHLAAGLFVAAFLAVYAVSAAQMASPLVNLPQSTREWTLTVPADVDTTPRGFARWLGQTHGIVGALDDVDESEGLEVRIVRVGTRTTVTLDLATRVATVEERRHSTIGMLNRLHHVSGLDAGWWPIDLWGLLLAVASALLLVLSGTGIVLWFQRHRERRTGLVVLVSGLALGLTLLVLMRAA